MRHISIDPAVLAEKPLRNILGMNNQPVIEIKRHFLLQKQWLDDLHLRHMRHHDAALQDPGGQFVDISRVFPLFHLDENDPRNYRFGPTDDYFSTVADQNFEIDFRLGESIDHSGFARFIQPPEDPEKWARICRNIIAHYKNGENNGMHMNITRVTVWEESDNKVLFTGTVEQYAALYIAVWKLFRKEFPDLKVGGPTMCAGNYPYLERFLTICREQEVTPDFITFTHYPRDLDSTRDICFRIREILDGFGFTETKIVISELHFGCSSWARAGDWTDGHDSSMNAAFTASILTRLMDVDSLDIAFYYAWANDIVWGVYRKTWPRRLVPVYFGLQFFNRVAADCRERLAVTCDADDTVEVLAGKTEDGKVRLLVSCFESRKTAFACTVKGAVSCSMKAVRTDYREEECREARELLPGGDGTFVFAQDRAGSDVFLLEFTMA